jgi:hypothetical protein
MEVGIREVAKVFRALDRGIVPLTAHYSGLHLSPVKQSLRRSTPRGSRTRTPDASQGSAESRHRSPAVPVSRTVELALAISFPSFRSYTSQEDKYRLVYERRLTEYVHKAVFKARMLKVSSSDSSQGADVVVKFAHRYGEEGHRLLADVGLAPRIHHCALEESVGMWVVVMDYVKGNTAHAVPLNKEQGDKLKWGVKQLHEKDLVFGDLRGPNVIVTGDASVSLIDFEWCGPCGNVRYPTDISQGEDMGWAPGVGRDQLITKEHDVHRLKILCT